MTTGRTRSSNHARREKRRRKIFGLVVALASLTSLAACSSSSNTSTTNTTTPGHVTIPGGLGSVPLAAANGPKKAGTITWAMQPGTAPNWIFPIVPGASNSVFNTFTFNQQMWRPLYWVVNGVVPEAYAPMSIADLPVYSNGDKTISITLKSTFKWSNGQPITANDLLFFLDLVKAAIKESPANWEGYVPGHLPDNLVSTSEPNASTLVMNLSQVVNPTWFTDDIMGNQGPLTPIPSTVWAKESANGAIIPPSGWTPATMKKIFDYLNSQAKSLSTYATNPLWQTVDGPYKLSAYNVTTGGFTMVPNTTYGGPHVTPMSNFQGEPFTSNAAEFNAIRAGAIDVAYIDFDDVPQLPTVLRLGYSYFGEAPFGLDYAAYNYKDTTGDFNNIIAQLYVRQAIAHLEDEAGYIKAIFGGAAGPAYGPVPALPASPYVPADVVTDPYPFSIPAAISLLTSHGWTVRPGGTDVCARAGTGPGQCGAGIPAGAKLAFNLVLDTQAPFIEEMGTDLASQAAKAGITISLQYRSFDFILTNYDDQVPADQVYTNEWAMADFGGIAESAYPTTFGIFNSTGTGNYGSYHNPVADRLIAASVAGGDPAAVKAEASFLTADQPGLFQPNPDWIAVWKTHLSGPPASFANLTQFYLTPEYWYFTG